MIPVILTINCGSSSLKSALITANDLTTLVSANVGHIGTPDTQWKLQEGTGKTLLEENLKLTNLTEAAEHLSKWLLETKDKYAIYAIGHRIVQGGREHMQPEQITDMLIRSLESLAPLAPEHLPASLQVVHLFREQFPDTLQVACFDTAFHQQMNVEARHYPLPRQLWKQGLVRYGFHGLSCEHVMQQLQQLDETSATKKIIIAHLGNGASITGVMNGQSVDTTMGLTPAGGLIMGTRTGDLDPGILIYLMRQNKMNANQLDRLVNEESGLKGIAGTSDMQALINMAPHHAPAAEAIDIFCYQARKWMGSMMAVLDGADLIVFTGGIGEHVPLVRKKICEGFHFAGIDLNEEANERQEPLISTSNSKIELRVIAANEEYIIAAHTKNILQKKSSN